MNTFEPNNSNIDDIEVVEEELSIEQVAQMEVYETLEETVLEEDSSEAKRLPLKPIPIPINKPLRLIKRNVSGRYESCPNPWKLELRIDVDGYRPTRTVSGDYYHVSGKTESYYGSFVVNNLQITVSSTQVTITGTADTTWHTSYTKIRIIIPRHTIFQPSANAYLQWMTTTNRKGASYTTVYKSRYFRTVQLEQDYEKGVTPFNAYNTGSLPSGGSARTLTVAKAYAEAGIQILDTGMSNEVRTSEAGSNLKWSNAELHAAMVKHFKRWKNEPQWKVWLFHTMRHEMGPGLRGIMFDQQGKQRQGCASFYQRISGTTATKLRDQLYVNVHELGHCFNLYHSFHKKYMNPPRPNRLNSKSWMNYPQKYPGGSAAFWSAFAFQFDNLEVVHLRHAFRNNIIIGGNPFGTGSALEDDVVVDNSGLKLQLKTAKTFVLGEPVVVEIKLSSTDSYGKEVHTQIHPNFSFVQISIQQPNGKSIVYEPPLEHLVEIETSTLDADNPSIYDSAYIGYDKEEGMIFDQSGVYKLRATYYALDGSIVHSDIISLRVGIPLNAKEEEVAHLFLGDEQGMLLYLLGSDSKSLEEGNKAFDRVIDEYDESPLAIYAHLIKGFNASREFKDVSTDNQIEIRKPQYGKANQFLSSVINASKESKGVDNITLNMTFRRKAQLQISAGQKAEAKETLKQMVDVFEQKQLKSNVIEHIMQQVSQIEKEL